MHLVGSGKSITTFFCPNIKQNKKKKTLNTQQNNTTKSNILANMIHSSHTRY